MINKISFWLKTISNLWIMLFTLLIMILFMITVLPGQAAASEKEIGSSRSPDTSFFYSPADLFQMAEEFGSAGRQSYIRSRWTFDLLFPLVYVSFLAVGISWFSKTLGNPPKIYAFINVLPVLGGVFDYLENSGASLLMGQYPVHIPGVALLTAVFSAIKWILVGGSFLAYFILAGTALYKWLASLKRN
jgi:hypothetical protein